MAKKSVIARELKRTKLRTRYAGKRAEFRKILSDPAASYEDKLLALKGLKKLPLNSSITRRRRRCRQDKCGRPRGVYRKFGLCRIHLREALMRGDVPGGRKASW